MMLVVGIAGGTASGKTTMSKKIVDQIGADNVSYIHHDSYYKDLSHIPEISERAKENFDHPAMYETSLLVEHLKHMKEGKAIECPQYDYKTYTRIGETVRLEPRKIIIVEGILVFCEQSLRSLLDVMIFVDTDADIRVLRRIQRDIEERGRTLQSVISQYEMTVRKMHIDFVEPSKRHAHLIIPEGGHPVGVSLVISKARDFLSKPSPTSSPTLPSSTTHLVETPS